MLLHVLGGQPFRDNGVSSIQLRVVTSGKNEWKFDIMRNSCVFNSTTNAQNTIVTEGHKKDRDDIRDLTS